MDGGGYSVLMAVSVLNRAALCAGHMAARTPISAANGRGEPAGGASYREWRAD